MTRVPRIIEGRHGRGIPESEFGPPSRTEELIMYMQHAEVRPHQAPEMPVPAAPRIGVSVLGIISLAVSVMYGLVAFVTTVLWMTSGSIFLPYDVETATPDTWPAVVGVAVGLGAAPVCLAAAILAIVGLVATRRHVGLPIAALVVSVVGLVPAGLLTVWAGTATYLWGWGR
jgi:hypothetical protein